MPPFIHSLIKAHLDNLHLFTIVTNAAMSTVVQIFLKDPNFNFFRYTVGLPYPTSMGSTHRKYYYAVGL